MSKQKLYNSAGRTVEEDAALNATGPGVAGITGEPPGPKNIFARLRRKKPVEMREEGDLPSPKPLKPHMSIEDIAQKHKVTPDYIHSQLKTGIPIEHEHTKDKEAARIIALQHLGEFPDYYTRLTKLEKSAAKKERSLKLEGDWKTKYAGPTPEDIPDEPEGTYQDFVNSWNSHIAKKKEFVPTPRIEKSPGIKAAIARALARRRGTSPAMAEVAEFPASGGSTAVDTRLYPPLAGS